MDVSPRHWPLFVTGLLLGAAGTMALGLHRPTPAELAAAAPATPTPAVAAPAVVHAAPDGDGAVRADEHMRAAAEAFRIREALAAATPLAVALAQPGKPRLRRVVKEADPEAIPVAIASGSPVASAPTATPEPPDPVAPVRSATSVLGGAPETVQDRPQPD